ncbi:probable sodium/hydrogen exchanger 4 at N-terminal half [Coccomyxa sp. Obi]|nr:probable sodium/hydrogen exchanger 4 at N-terminal half [Coccomyxa sp. Obi]
MMVFSMILWMSLGHKLSHRFFLPPIILYAGLSVRKKAFFRNLPTIASLGILGTYIAFAVIAVTLFGFSKFINISLADCLALGAIFATTDSVAVLQVLEQDRAPLLFNMVFGEGVINDATTVALLRTVQRLGETPKMNMATVGTIFGKFLYLFAISLLLGLVFGLFCSLLLKKFNVPHAPQARSTSNHPLWDYNIVLVQAVGIVGMVAYLSYLVGDYTGLSGIVSLFCCSVTMSHYALHNITKQQRAAVMSFFETISFMSEGSIFVYVGLDALDPLKWKNTFVGPAMSLFAIIMVLLLVSRGVFVFPILAAHNYFFKEKLPFRQMVVAWWAGAMRGAVSVALVYLYYDPDGTTVDKMKSSLISMTLTVVLFSTIVYGAITKPMLDLLLGAKPPSNHGEHEHEGIELMMARTPQDGSPKIPAAYSVVDVAPSDSGYETDATAFSEGAFSDEDDRASLEGNETGGLLAHHGARADERGGEEEMLREVPDQAAPNQATSPYPASRSRPQARDLHPILVKGDLRRFQTPPADSIPPQGEGTSQASWDAFGANSAATSRAATESHPSTSTADVQQSPFNAGAPASSFAVPLPLPAPRAPRIKFGPEPPNLKRTASEGSGLASMADSSLAKPAETAAVPSTSAASRAPLRVSLKTAAKGKRQSVQLSEWWADFDERVMKPVFNKPDALESWTPRSDGGDTPTAVSLDVLDSQLEEELGKLLDVLVPSEVQQWLLQDIQALALDFCSILGHGRITATLALIDNTMCPRWHSDHVTMRLLCTYIGAGTEFVENRFADRRPLQRLLFQDTQGYGIKDEGAVQRASPGDVLFLKGHSFPGNSGCGAVHRSPAASAAAPRLVLTLDEAAAFDILECKCGGQH